MSRALYRKYRSKSLSELVGQQHVTDVLSRAIKTGRISHAYLLTGPRGVGKTSVARILAHEINGLPYTDDSSHLDIIEIDAASNNGVEDVRSLREKVQIAPVSAQKKIYIIDEVHMLSKPAFNALLKTLEEPPEHVVFILATTDIDKLPATIVSRTQRFSFRAIGHDDAVAHLRSIATAENINVDDAALDLIATRGDGSFRDSISLLDQLATLADTKQGITAELVETTLGLAPHALVDDLLTAVEQRDIATVIQLLDTATRDGIGAIMIAHQLAQTIRGRAAESPQLLPLLDALLDVSKSAQADLKLLSVLGSAATPKTPPKTVALAAPVREVHASVAALKKQSNEDVVSVTKTAPIPTPKHSTKKPPASPSGPFEWETLIEYTRLNHVPLFAVLSKCSYAIDGSDLTIYTRNAFYKKKLDDAKYLPLLHQSLEAMGSYALTIHTVPTAPPPKSSQAAAVAAIMGGGEEITLEPADTPAGA